MNRYLAAALLAGTVLVALGVYSSRPPAAARREAAGSYLIRNVRIFDGERMAGPVNVSIRDGRIGTVGAEEPAAAHVIDGTGRTLLPGLIDAHTHAFGDALERALQFGVTTELDMFTDFLFAGRMRAEQRNGQAATRADLYSAGTLVTAPGGHGTEYGMIIPTIASAAEARSFVQARIAEGSDYIKIVYDDGDSYGLEVPTISRDVLEAVIAAARAEDRLAVVHIGSRSEAEDAIRAGASGLIHIFADRPADAAFVDMVVRSGAFVTPTLSVTESVSGVASGASLVDDPRLGEYLSAADRAALKRSFPRRQESRIDFGYALAATKMLFEAGVPLLAGTDAPNPGTAHGASIHRELELLVRAGLTPEAALAAASSVPARVFGLDDRGRIAPGLRADLVLVAGDPSRDITATRDIVSIWKGGALVTRTPGSASARAPSPATSGTVSDFESGEAKAGFGTDWQISTDKRLGGKSEASMEVVEGGANGTRRALAVTGAIHPGAPYPWAGPMFFPGEIPMTPVNLSRFKEIVFWARGDGSEHQLMVFADRLGNIPAAHAFTAGPEWREFVVSFSSLGLDGSDIRGLLFSAGNRQGPFSFAIDEIRFR